MVASVCFIDLGKHTYTFNMYFLSSLQHLEQIVVFNLFAMK